MKRNRIITTLLIVCMSLLLAFGFVGCKPNDMVCVHTYDNACDVTCNECGEERTVEGHNWVEADCDTPKTCKVCGVTEGSALGHTPENDDNDCSTALNCGVCGEEILAAGEHTPERDDGNCTTEQKCTVCGQTAVEASTGHNDTDGDYLCDNGGCQITVEGAPKDENDGIDLPIDRN